MAKTIAPGLRSVPRIHGDPKSAIKKAEAEPLFFLVGVLLFSFMIIGFLTFAAIAMR